ncbi:unnamed protein product [Sphagnum jensenii]
MKPPTVIVPVGVKPTVVKLFDVHRELDGSELEHCLLGLDVGLYCVLSKEQVEKRVPWTPVGENKVVEIVRSLTPSVPEVAFTGDTTPDFILDKANKDVLESKLLIMEVSSPIPHAAVVIET